MPNRPGTTRRDVGVRFGLVASSPLVPSVGRWETRPGPPPTSVPGSALAGSARIDSRDQAPPPWAPPRLDGALDAMVRDVARPEGVAAVAVHHLSTGFGMALRADAVVPPASLFKVGLMVATMRDVEAGRLALERELAITEEDWAPGAGILQDQVGGTVTVEGALRLMIGISDNVAAFVLLRAVGASRFNAVTASLGMARTRFYVDGRLDETSAGDMATVLAHLAAGGAAGADSTRYMVALLLQRQAAAWIRDALPPGIRVAHKSGQLPGTRNDAAIVSMPDGEYVVAVLTSDLADDRDGETYVAEVARTVHRHFSTGG